MFVLAMLFACQSAADPSLATPEEQPVISQTPDAIIEVQQPEGAGSGQAPKRLPAGADIELVHMPVVPPKDATGVTWEGHKRVVDNPRQRDNAKALGRDFQKKIEHTASDEQLTMTEDQ